MVPTQVAKRRPSTSRGSEEPSSREAYRKDLSPRIRRKRISSKRQRCPSPQTSRRSVEARPSVAFSRPPASLRLLSKGRQGVDNGQSCPPLRSSLFRGERRRAETANLDPEALAGTAEGNFCEIGVGMLRFMFGWWRSHWNRTTKSEARPAPTPRGRSEVRGGEASSPSHTSSGPSCWIPTLPLGDVKLGSIAFGSSAAPEGPVALRPSVAAGLPLSCHREGAETYCEISAGQVGAPNFVLVRRAGTHNS